MRGWTFNGSLWLNDGVGRDPHAIERGGSVAFDPATLATIVTPWAGDGTELWHTPILPDGTKVGTPEELDYGWRYPCTGPLERIEVVDLRLTNQLSYLKYFPGEGLKVLWWMPTAQVKDDGGGWWRPKRIKVSGPGRFEAYEQPEECGEGEERPAYAKGSIAYYGAEEETGVVLRPDGSIRKARHTGKIHHAPRPTALFWAADGRLVGIVYGRLEWDRENSQEVKCYPLDKCAALVAAGAVQVSIDATLGYTTVGATSWGSTGAEYIYAGVGLATEYGEITGYAMYLNQVGGTATQIFGGLYVGFTATTIGALVPNGNVPAEAVGSIPRWFTHTYAGTKPVMEKGTRYRLGAFPYNTTATAMQGRLDTGGTNSVYYRSNGAAITTPPDPASYASQLDNRKPSAYLTYTSQGATKFYTPTVHPAADGDLVPVGKFAVESWDLGPSLQLTVTDWKTRLKVECPPNRFDRTTYPNIDPNAADQSIPIGFGKLFDLPCTLIDSTTKRFKVLGNPLATFDELRADGAPITPTSLDTYLAEFVWDGYDPEEPATLTADVTCLYTNPADVIAVLLTTYAGENDLLVPTGPLDVNYRKGFGAYGSRLSWVYGATRDGVEAHCPEISLYIATPTSVLDVIGQVLSASFGRFYYAPEGYWYLDQWEPVRGEDVAATFLDHEIFELTPTVSSSERITAITLNYKKFEASGLVQIYAAASDELRYLANVRQNVSAARDVPFWQLRDVEWYASRVLAMEGRPLKTWEAEVNQRGWLLRPGMTIRMAYAKRAVDQLFEVLEVGARPGEGKVKLLLGDNRGFADRPGFWTVDAPTFPASLGGGSAEFWDAGWTVEQKTWARQNVGYWLDDNEFADDDRDSYKGSVWV